jgi:hypothetical protein
MWSLGGTIGPFIVARFLVELPHSTAKGILSANGDGCTTNDSLVANCSGSGNVLFQALSELPIAKNHAG